MKLRINQQLKYFLVWLIGISCGFGFIFIIGPYGYKKQLNRSVETMLLSNDPQVIEPIIDELYKNEDSRQFVTGMLFMNIDGIPATNRAKLCALEKIRESDDFNLAFNIFWATLDSSPDVRQKAIDIYKEYLYISIYPQLSTLIRQLGREDNSDIFNEKVELICNLLNISYEDTKKYFEENGVDADIDFLLEANYNQGEYLRSQLPENPTEKLY